MNQEAVNAHLTRLSIVADRVANVGHVGEGIEAALQAVKDLFSAQTVALLALDDRAENLRVLASRGLSPSFASAFARSIGTGIIAEISLGGMALLLAERAVDEDAYNDARLEHDFGSAMAVQLAANHKPLGVLYCDHRDAGRFSRNDLQLFRCLALLASVAMEKQDLQDKVSRLAITDTVTGLYTYNHFYNRLADDIARSLRYGGSLGVLLFEIAHLASIEETYGRLAAEETLRYVADKVRENTRGIDYACRYGGDQVAVALIRTDKQGIRGVADRISPLIGETSITCTSTSPAMVPELRSPEPKRGVKTLCVSVYIAGVVAPEHGRNMADLSTSLEAALSSGRSLGPGNLALARE